MTKWIPVDEQMPPEHGRCLVTNNINARDAHGMMSHVWLLHPVVSQNKETLGEIVGFDDADRNILGITHWMPIEGVTPSD